MVALGNRLSLPAPRYVQEELVGHSDLLRARLDLQSKNRVKGIARFKDWAGSSARGDRALVERKGTYSCLAGQHQPFRNATPMTILHGKKCNSARDSLRQ